MAKATPGKAKAKPAPAREEDAAFPRGGGSSLEPIELKKLKRVRGGAARWAADAGLSPESCPAWVWSCQCRPSARVQPAARGIHSYSYAGCSC